MFKKIFLIVFALFIVGMNITLRNWNQSFRSEKIPYLKDVSIRTTSKIAFDQQGRLWIFSAGELRVYKDSELIEVFTEKDSPILGEEGVGFEIKFDNKGRAWFGSYGGPVDLALFDGTNWRIILGGSSTSTKSGGLNALNIDPQGRVWVGIQEQGLKIFDGQNWETYSTANSVLTSNTIQAIAFDNQGRAWIGSWLGGLYIIDGENWQIFNEANSPILSDRIYDIVFDKKGQAWISTHKGISVFDGANWTNYSEPQGANIFVDHKGQIWAIPRAYIGKPIRVFDGKVWKYYFDASRTEVIATAIDENENIWLATKNGIVTIEPNSTQPVTYNVILANSIITSEVFIYLTILLIAIWFAVILETWRIAQVGFFGFLVYLGWMGIFLWIFGLHFIGIPNPGAVGTIGGIIGSIVDEFFPNSNIMKRRWAWLGLIGGTILSTFYLIPAIFAQ